MTYSPCAQTNWTIEYYLREMAKHEKALGTGEGWESPTHFFHEQMATHYYLEAEKLMAKPSPLLGRPTKGTNPQ